VDYLNDSVAIPDYESTTTNTAQSGLSNLQAIYLTLSKIGKTDIDNMPMKQALTDCVGYAELQGNVRLLTEQRKAELSQLEHLTQEYNEHSKS
jgi:hypothetical protein